MEKIPVRKWRINAEISQGQMAKNLGITRNTYILKEQGISQFTVTEVNKICTILNVDFYEVDWNAKWLHI